MLVVARASTRMGVQGWEPRRTAEVPRPSLSAITAMDRLRIGNKRRSAHCIGDSTKARPTFDHLRRLMFARRTTRAIGVALALTLSAAGLTLAQETTVRSAGNNSITASTVTASTTATTVCNVGTGVDQTNTPLFAGSASTGFTGGGTYTPCSLTVTYHSTASAYLGLDVLIAAKAGAVASGAPAGTTALALYDGTTKGLQVQITDTINGSSTYFVNGTKYLPQGTGATTTDLPTLSCPAPYTSGYTCYQVTKLLASTSVVSNGSSDTFSVNYQLPATSTAGYENSSAAIVLTAHVVQAANDPVPASGATKCSATAQCSSAFSWS
jgi:hypothetical protein